jgi:8-oxo-dGTP diphosphatase
MSDLGPPPQALLDGFAVSYAVACAFFTDAEGRVLLVKANDRDHWQFVGGMVDRGESPHEACARETKEEIGLSLPTGDLLVLDWIPQHAFVSAPMAIFLFDGGVIEDPDLIRLQAEELEKFDFFPPDQATLSFPEGHRERVELALEARRTGKSVYQPLLSPAPLHHAA